MDIFIYSDESGVLDKVHNEYFVFGGLVFLSCEEKDNAIRRYLAIERCIKQAEGLSHSDEAKANKVSNNSKGKLYRSLKGIEKFGVYVRQRYLLDSVFTSKKTKQRYLDYAFKIAIKRKFERLIREGKIDPSEVESLHFYVDEHSTATDGRYELCEALEQEFRFGTHNWNWNKFHPPLFNNLEKVKLQYCNSATVPLIRASDVVANKLYYCVANSKLSTALIGENFNIVCLP